MNGKLLTSPAPGWLAGRGGPGEIWTVPRAGAYASSRFDARRGKGAATRIRLDGGLGLGGDPGTQ